MVTPWTNDRSDAVRMALASKPRPVPTRPARLRPYPRCTVTQSSACPGMIQTGARRPSAIDRRLRGDVDTIVQKALEKDRAWRYQSAAELGQDVRHFLRSEPIAARKATRVY